MDKCKCKVLTVTGFPQHQGYVPWVRVAGKWLERFGFTFGDKVEITSEAGLITIKKLPVQEHSRYEVLKENAKTWLSKMDTCVAEAVDLAMAECDFKPEIPPVQLTKLKHRLMSDLAKHNSEAGMQACRRLEG